MSQIKQNENETPIVTITSFNNVLLVTTQTQMDLIKPKLEKFKIQTLNQLSFKDQDVMVLIYADEKYEQELVMCILKKGTLNLVSDFASNENFFRIAFAKKEIEAFIYKNKQINEWEGISNVKKEINVNDVITLEIAKLTLKEYKLLSVKVIKERIVYQLKILINGVYYKITPTQEFAYKPDKPIDFKIELDENDFPLYPFFGMNEQNFSVKVKFNY